MTNEGGAPRAKYFRGLRWTIAIGGLLIFAGLLLNNSFEICNVETATNKDGTTVTKTCDGPTVTDASVVAIALLVVLLLAPDMSEVGIFGVSLKRRVEAAEAQASKSEAKADKLETQLQLLRIETLNQAAANAQASVTNYIGDFLKKEDAVAIPALELALPLKGEEFTHDVESRPSTAAVQPNFTDEYTRMATRLIWNWEVIAASLDLPPYPRDGRSDIPRVPVTGTESQRFANVFAEELRIVRVARNTVAHARPITDDELQAAVDMSERLLAILGNRGAQ